MKNKKLFWIYVLSASIYFTQGIESLPGLAFFFYLKEKLGFTPEKIMYISALTGLAWVIKPIYGFIVDNFLSNKKWIILSLFGSIAISLFFGLSLWLPVTMIIVMGIIGNFNSALRDVSVDGLMCVQGKETKSCDTIQACQWIAITIASIIVGLSGGYIADHLSYRFAYLCLIPIYLIIIGIVLKYKSGNAKRLIATGNNQKPLATLLSYKELFANKSFLIGCVFLFLYKFSPSFGTPLQFIQRNNFHWSGTWMGTLGAICSVFEIIGAILFFKCCKKINTKKWLYYSVFLGALTSLAYLYYTPKSAIVYGILFGIMGMFVHLIVLSIMAKNSLKGKEATSFALLCGVSNLATGTASSLVGAWLFPLVGLKFLIILSAFTSFLCLPLINKIKIENE
jgi:Na+/melibiose symporter-like transporter